MSGASGLDEVPVHIRPLRHSDWEAFRDFRLAALLAEPGVFSSSYEKEVDYPPRRWQRTILGPTNQAFGLFDGEEFVGITAVFTHRDDPSGETAHLAMSFIKPEYRGKGLSGMLYEARLEWVAAHPKFNKIVVSHRASNEASRRANQRYGFVPIGREPHTWPDGETEDQVFYERRL